MKTLSPALPIALAVAYFSVIASCTNGDDPDPEYGPAGGMLEVDAGEMRPGTGSGGSGASGRGGIGRACETDANCKAGLFCHESADYIGHKQCTMACGDSETCQDHTAGTFCIGANICVQSCTTGTECPSLTRCNEASWCERGGPGSGVPECAGSATLCSLLPSGQCRALGCRSNDKCEGFSTGCYSLFSSFSCSSQQGCYWSSSSRDCSGVARSCSGFASDVGCTGQAGCSWSEQCTGVAESCETLSLNQCALQPGCYIDYNP